MVTLLITSVLVIGLIAIAIYFWQKPATARETIELPPPPVAGLFSNPEPVQVAATEERLLTESPAVQDSDERHAKRQLAEESIEKWQQSPHRNSTAEMLHLAAISDDAETYDKAAELALNAWQSGRLRDVSAAELQNLLNSEFWLLSSNTRNSGAGFVLKRTLSRAKRELETANNPTNRSTASS